MRVEMLSDHGGALLRGSRDRLRGTVAAWQLEYRQAWAHMRAVHRAKSVWRRLHGATPVCGQPSVTHCGSWQEVLLHEQPRAPVPQPVAVPHRAPGGWGEDPLTAALGVLPDEWVMLRGYRNRRGETDHVLVGPQGIWAVAVKRRRIRLHAVGDRWWWEKLDARGRSVETGWAVDGGRSWARQVNDIADDLAAWLRRNRHDVPVRTAVVLLHEQAQLGRCQDPTVSLVGTEPTHLLEALARYAAPLAAPEIADLVRRDHAFHQRRRDRRL